jgi:hypothetical protein
VNVEEGLVTVRIGGIVTPAEQARGQQAVAEAIQKQGKVKVLVLAQGFQGWSWSKGDWSDVSFQAQYDVSIEKMAFVGDRKWDDLARVFTGKGLRQVPIEFFPDEEKARVWLDAPSTPVRR